MTDSTYLNDSLDSLVGDWLTLPDLAEILGVEVGATRRMVEERRIVGIRRGSPKTFQVPARFVVPEHLADPGNARTPSLAGGVAVLTSLQGTLNVLADGGFSDEEAIGWLFSVSDELGQVPIEELRAGHKARVRQAAQALA